MNSLQDERFDLLKSFLSFLLHFSQNSMPHLNRYLDSSDRWDVGMAYMKFHVYPLSTLCKQHSIFNLLFSGMACDSARSINLLCYFEFKKQTLLASLSTFSLSCYDITWGSVKVCGKEDHLQLFHHSFAFSSSSFLSLFCLLRFYLQFKEITYGLQRTNASTLLRSCLEYVMNYCHRFMPGEGGYLLDLLQNVSYFQLSCIISIIFIARISANFRCVSCEWRDSREGVYETFLWHP